MECLHCVLGSIMVLNIVLEMLLEMDISYETVIVTSQLLEQMLRLRLFSCCFCNISKTQ